jgi:hypothetical protein
MKFKGPCLYFLIFNNDIIYIGQTIDLTIRLQSHKRTKTYDTVRFIPCDKDRLNHYENRLIKYFKPKLNSLKESTVNRLTRGNGLDRISLRISTPAMDCALKMMDEQNRTFNNLIETLIFEACKK